MRHTANLVEHTGTDLSKAKERACNSRVTNRRVVRRKAFRVLQGCRCGALKVQRRLLCARNRYYLLQKFDPISSLIVML